MTRNRLTGILILSFLMMFAQVASAEAIRIRTGVYRPDGIYKSGETAKFTVQAIGELPPEGLPAKYTIMFNEMTTVSAGTLLIKDSSPAVVTAKSKKPGQLICRFYFDVPTTGSKMIGAIYDPYKIKPSMRTPWDFGRFWAKQKKTLEGGYSPVVTPVASKDPNVDLYHVIIPMPEGRPVQGYMAKPKGAKPKSIGAIAFTHGAGVRSSRIPNTSLGMISFDFNAHGIDDGMPNSYYSELDKGALKEYRRGRESRDEIYFRGMYLRLVRAIDFLTKQPEWDGKVLVVYGGSQGGAQALVAAGLDPRVSCIVSAYPALSDLTAYRAGRDSGWPHPVPLDKNRKCANKKIEKAERYYDCVNFAKRIKADTFFMVGLIDTTCSPTSIFAAYNAVPAKNKTIDIVPGKGHNSLVGKESRDATQFIRDHMARMKGEQKVAAK
ncbi:acetylxylan esterase [bacterium]|nr:acetylxylan esterase [bacterium]